MGEYWWIMVIIWAVVFIATLVLELITADLNSIWFIISSLVVLVISAFNIVEYWVQLIIFVVLSVFLVIVTRPLTKKMMDREIIKTNTDKYIGMIGKIISKSETDDVWEIRVDGSLWRAFNKDGLNFEIDENVIVEGISGNKLIINKVNSIDNIQTL